MFGDPPGTSVGRARATPYDARECAHSLPWLLPESATRRNPELLLQLPDPIFCLLRTQRRINPYLLADQLAIFPRCADHRLPFENVGLNPDCVGVLRIGFQLVQ